MTKILNSLPQFIKAIESQQQIVCDVKGNWKVPGSFARHVQKMITKKGEEDSLLIAFNRALENVELKTLHINGSQKEKKFYEDVIRATRSVVKLYEHSTSANIKKLRNSLELSLINLQYRVQAENGGLNVLRPHEIDMNMVQALEKRVEEWKNEDEKYEHAQKVDFSPKIREMCQYPEIVKFLLDPKNEAQSNPYLQLAFRDNFSLEVLNQYYYETRRLHSSYMCNRIGNISRNLISVDLVQDKAGSSTKVLNLLMENKKVNLLDKKQKVRFSNGLNWTLAQIYQDFRLKKKIPGDLEMMWDGVVPFNGHEMGPRIIPKNIFSKVFAKKKYQHIDTSQPGWYEKTPKLDYRSRAYIEAKYNIKVQPGQAVTVLESTRREKLDIEGSHGYTLVYLPVEENNYRVYAFGAFAFDFPQNNLELAVFVGDTVEGVMAFDPNYFYSQSQKASWAKAVDEKVARALLDELGRRRSLGMIFQFGWENCAFFIHSVFVKIFKEMNVGIEVPNFFTKKFVKIETKSALKIVKERFEKTPEELMPAMKLLVALGFGAMRTRIVWENGKKIKKSLWTSPFFEELKINLPCSMHHGIEKTKKGEKKPVNKEKYADCVLNYGHTPNIMAPVA